MVRVRIAFALAALLCLAPAFAVIAATSIAAMYGCTLHEGFANPCIVFGHDIGGPLASLFVMGWLMLATLPVLGFLAFGWIVAEVIAWRRRQVR